MPDDPQASSREKFIRFGDLTIQVTEPLPIQPVTADAVCELRLVGSDTIALGLVTLIRDGDGPPEARVCARLRLPLTTLADIQRGAIRLIENQTKAKAAAN